MKKQVFLLLGFLVGAGSSLGSERVQTKSDAKVGVAIKFPSSIFDVTREHKGYQIIPAITEQDGKFGEIFLVRSYGPILLEKAEQKGEAFKFLVVKPGGEIGTKLMVPNQQVVIDMFDEATKQELGAFMFVSRREKILAELVEHFANGLIQNLKVEGYVSRLVERDVDTLLASQLKNPLEELRFGLKEGYPAAMERFEKKVSEIMWELEPKLKEILDGDVKEQQEIERLAAEKGVELLTYPGSTAQERSEVAEKLKIRMGSILRATMEKLRPKFENARRQLLLTPTSVLKTLTVGDFFALYTDLFIYRGQFYILNKRLIEKAKSFPVKLGVPKEEEPVLVITKKRATEILGKKKGDLVFMDDKVVVIDTPVFWPVYWTRRLFKQIFGY